MTLEGAIAGKLAGANPRKVARWTADRLRDAARGLSWHAARAWMQIRDATARSPGFPPGSLSASCTRASRTDDRFYLAQLRRHGAVFKLFWGSGHLKVCVVGFPLGRRLLNQHRGVLRLTNTTDITSLVPAEYLRSMSPEIHPKYRRRFRNALRDDLVAAQEPELRSIVSRGLAELAETVTSELSPAERLYETLNGIAMKALLLAVLGVRPDSKVAPVLEDAYRRLGPDGHVAQVGPRQAEGFHAIRAIVLQILQSMRNDSAEPVADSMLGRLQRAEPPDVDETVIGNTIYMVERGRHDMRDLLRWIVKYLGDNPSLIAELGADAVGGHPNARLAEACVLETLRLDQAELLGRKALAAFTFEGFHIPKNSWVSILLRESHRDPTTFDAPDSFRPQRFLERTYSADEYSPFGIDEHQCIGASLVRRIGTLFIEELVTGFRWSVSSDGPRRHGHLHWEPSPSFAIRIQRGS